jgi:hypothetical protein
MENTYLNEPWLWYYEELMRELFKRGEKNLTDSEEKQVYL